MIFICLYYDKSDLHKEKKLFYKTRTCALGLIKFLAHVPAYLACYKKQKKKVFAHFFGFIIFLLGVNSFMTLNKSISYFLISVKC